MSKKPAPARPGFSIGLEFDHRGIRAARLASNGKGDFAIEALEDLYGDFSDDAALATGLRQIREKLNIGARDSMIACLSGKQVFAGQITFRRLPPEEMEQALRIEMRKSVSFELGGCTLDYQVLSDDGKSETVQVLVAVVAAGLANRSLKALERAGFKPTSVDVLPVALANVMWNGVGTPKRDAPCVAVHIGPQISTIVVDGAKSPFFNRYIHFPAEEVFGKEDPMGDREKRVTILAEEVARSLAFYEKNSFVSGFTEILLLGDYLDLPSLEGPLRRLTGLNPRKLDLPKKLGQHNKEPGRFDLAVSLAMRGDE